VEARDPSGVSSKDLIARLDLEKSIVSKLLRQLKNERLISLTPAPSDNRSRIVQLTETGKRLLKGFDKASNDRLKDFETAGGLTAEDTRQIAGVLAKLADHLGALPSLATPADHPLRPPIRRLTRAFHLLGRRALGSTLSALEWQTLLTICENSSSLSPSDLVTLFRTPKAALAVALSELENRGYITRKQDPHDGRFWTLHGLKRGFDAVALVERENTERFSVFSDLKESDVAIVERWIRSAAVHFHLLQHDRLIRPLLKPQEFQAARRFLLNTDLPVPESCFPDTGGAIGLFDGVRLVAAVQFKNQKKKGRELTTKREIVSLAWHRPLSTEALRAFTAVACDRKIQTPFSVQGSPYTSVLAPEGRIPTALASLFS
jgi:DNA-binding MarR family transcriptional regulator